MKLRYRTVFLSDTHLGSRGAQARDLIRFLRCIDCQKLYLVGDIVDLWRMRRSTFWPPEHNDAVQAVLRMAQDGVDVRFVPGNHDEAARPYAGLEFGGVKVVMHDEHETLDGRRYLITHGDQFDLVVRHSRLLSLLGSAAYETLIVVNRFYNRWRAFTGREYWSLAQYLKLKVKRACTYVSQFEDAVAAEARKHALDGVVCGHIHKAERRMIGSIEYLNCGDWIESCSAVVEHLDGSLEVIEALPTIAQMVRHARRTDHPSAVRGADTASAPAQEILETF